MRTMIERSGALCSLSLCVWTVALSGSSVAAESGRVFVKSDPSGAKVFLDDEKEPRGKTPCILKGLAPGTHALRARLAGYADVVQEVEVDEGAMGRASFAFTVKTEGEGEAGTTTVVVGTEPTGGPADKPDKTSTEPADAPAEGDETPEHIFVDCPVCRGTALLQEMGCPACQGTGWTGVSRCAECNSTRKVEFNCPYCRGIGILTRGGKESECPKCSGKGKLPCTFCRGKGKLKRKNPDLAGKPTINCPYCQGIGFESNVKCRKCGGRGKFIPTAPGLFISSHVDCPFCGGDGVGPPLCRRCQGTGVLSPRRNPVMCPSCFGTGHAFLPCKGCRGQGWIRSR